MQYISHYCSPLGNILLMADDIGLVGIWFEDQKYFACSLDADAVTQDVPVLKLAKEWLDNYFIGNDSVVNFPLHLIGTDFQLEVWQILCEIPYGETTTYGEIAKKLADKRGLKTMSAQAVGGAVGRNPISIIVPCHRVIGKNGSMTGYAGGIEKKIALLSLEKASVE